MQPPQSQPQPQPEAAHRRAASSSSTCSTAPRRGIGCMAGLLRLISPYHRSHHRKRLTAKNNAAQASAPSMPSSPTKKKAAAAAATPLSTAPPSPVKPPQKQQPPAAVRRRRSCDAPRSPTIAPEHRRSSCDSPRPPPPAIVARLMGLEESAPPSPAAASATPPRPAAAAVVPTRPPPAAAPETAAEKRRKLLGALEKCDEDLKTLRRIIAAVRAAEMRAAAASDAACVPAAAVATPPARKGAGAGKWMVNSNYNSPSTSPSPPLSSQQHSKLRGVEEQLYPSPDSVLDAISSPRFPCRKRPSPCTDLDAGGKGSVANGAVAPSAVGSKIVKPSRTLVFTGDYCKIKSCDEPTLRLHAVHHLVPPVAAIEASPLRLPRAAGAESWRHHRRRWELEAAAAGRVISRAMVESVGDAMWGPPPQGRASGDEQSRERGMVVAALERAIVQDLVAELLTDLLAMSGRGHGAGCRKRLCF
ncbi:unnamed protein product [Urochloa humidicola]